MPSRFARFRGHSVLSSLVFGAVLLAEMGAVADSPNAAHLVVDPLSNQVQFADGSALPAAEHGNQLQLSSGQSVVPTPAQAEPRMLTPQETLPATPATPAASVATPPAASGAPLTPVPEAKNLGPSEIEVTSFHGITPGTSTRSDVEKAWGKPKQTKNADGSVVQWYAVDLFPRVEVGYANEKVASLIIRFDRAFPASQVAEQLEQLGLTKVQPVLVLNELGEVLGQAYPERGVMFGFEPASDPSKALKKVTHIILEAISAEPFVLRAETNLDTRPEFSLHDVDEAIKLDPKNARSHWLRSRALTALGKHEQAALAATEAVRLNPRDALYKVTEAETLIQTRNFAAAVAAAERAIDLSESRPHVRARAICLLGDLKAAGPKPDYKQALRLHTEALTAAKALRTERHPAVRVAAKEVLLDAHLGALQDIAWGPWKGKEQAAGNWLTMAAEIADDLIKNEQGSDEYLFRVAVKALLADVGMKGKLDPAKWARETIRSGDSMIAAAPEAERKAELQYQVSKALYDAVQVYQMRGDADDAYRQGEAAIGYLDRSQRAQESSSAAYLLGRTYFRMGAICANNRKDHRSAINWFEKAVPLLGKAPPPEAMPDLARLGDTFVSMGVSYWETGYKKKAIALTEHGADLIEEAIRRGSGNGRLDRSLLVTPYSNLAVMHREVGDTAASHRMQELAEKAKGTTIR